MDPNMESPEKLSPVDLPRDHSQPEVSMVEASDVTGVTFSPELWMQRRQWALEVLKRENARSVLDVGCGPGALLETLVIPPTTIHEDPIIPRSGFNQKQEGSLPDSDKEDSDLEMPQELFLTRLGGLDTSPSILSSALNLLSPSAPTSLIPTPSTSTSTTASLMINPSNPPITPYIPGTIPRWEPLMTELYLGGIEKYNSKLENYDAIVMLEVIEHLEPEVLSRFGVVTLGTYRPRLLLVTTPNFDFNAKFPRAEEEGFKQKGFVDPTGRTERVFRHSDHKVEMTSEEFRSWAESSASDWGYSVEVSGVGISSIPSYYPPSDANDPNEPKRPIYATQTAIFRIASGLPTRSPRSVRSVELPFMPSKESTHPHKLVGRFIHPISAPGISPSEPVNTASGSTASITGISTGIGKLSISKANSSRRSSKTTSTKEHINNNNNSRPDSPRTIRERVCSLMEEWKISQVSIEEIWAKEEICGGCKGSKRYLVSCLGGYGDCQGIVEGGEGDMGMVDTSTGGGGNGSGSGSGISSSFKGTVGSWLNNARSVVGGSGKSSSPDIGVSAGAGGSSGGGVSGGIVERGRDLRVVRVKDGLAIRWEGYVAEPKEKERDESWGMEGLKLDNKPEEGGW